MSDVVSFLPISTKSGIEKRKTLKTKFQSGRMPSFQFHMLSRFPIELRRSQGPLETLFKNANPFLVALLDN